MTTGCIQSCDLWALRALLADVAGWALVREEVKKFALEAMLDSSGCFFTNLSAPTRSELYCYMAECLSFVGWFLSFNWWRFY